VPDANPDPMAVSPSERVIVEVTPRWRAIMAAQGADWSKRALRDRLLGRWIKATGWMLFDAEHQNQSENTAPRRESNWRATDGRFIRSRPLRLCSDLRDRDSVIAWRLTLSHVRPLT